MNDMKVLFEPLPIGRLGVRMDDESVVIGTDFSSFAYMFEEFISLGAIQIAIPKSFPEIDALSDAPKLLRQRIVVLDDDSENVATDQVLNPVIKELGIGIDYKSGNLSRPKNLPKHVFIAMQRVRRDLRCMALGFNNSLHVDLDSNATISSSRLLREHIQQSDARTILASLEGILACYKDIKFDSVSPKIEAPSKMISVFDQLVNDPQYLELSRTVVTLSDESQRRGALSRLRSIGRSIVSSNFITTGWDTTAKLLKVWTGIPLPDSSLFSILLSGKTLPSLVVLHTARERALKMWMTSADHSVPFRRSGTPLSGDEIHWLPPCNSMKATHPGETLLHLGTVGELKRALKLFEDSQNAKR